MTVGLVACCGAKLPHAAPARDLYVSPLFTKARHVVERTCSSWGILSAKYGLVMPDAIVEPYDLRLDDLPYSALHTWAAVTRAQLVMTWPLGRFVVYAGAKYRRALHGLICAVPLAGLGIGRQLQALTIACAALDREQAHA